MGKSSVPFKTNVKRPLQVPDKKTSDWPAKVPKDDDGYFFTPRSRPIRAYVVNEKKEKTKRFQWVLTWVAVIPLGFMILLWLALFFAELFTG
jgi:hypothetical protein